MPLATLPPELLDRIVEALHLERQKGRDNLAQCTCEKGGSHWVDYCRPLLLVKVLRPHALRYRLSELEISLNGLTYPSKYLLAPRPRDTLNLRKITSRPSLGMTEEEQAKSVRTLNLSHEGSYRLYKRRLRAADPVGWMFCESYLEPGDISLFGLLNSFKGLQKVILDMPWRQQEANVRFWAETFDRAGLPSLRFLDIGVSWQGVNIFAAMKSAKLKQQLKSLRISFRHHTNKTVDSYDLALDGFDSLRYLRLEVPYDRSCFDCSTGCFIAFDRLRLPSVEVLQVRHMAIKDAAIFAAFLGRCPRLSKVALIINSLYSGSWQRIFESLDRCDNLRCLLVQHNRYHSSHCDALTFEGDYHILHYLKSRGELETKRLEDVHALADLLRTYKARRGDFWSGFYMGWADRKECEGCVSNKLGRVPVVDFPEELEHLVSMAEIRAGAELGSGWQGQCERARTSHYTTKLRLMG